MSITKQSNEWWLSENGNLHIGEDIKSHDGCCTVSSLRYEYHKNDLELVVHQPYCFVYSKQFPFLDIWECYKNNDNNEYPTASISWIGRFTGQVPEDLKDIIYNVKKFHHYPFFIDRIEFPYIVWKNGDKTLYDDIDVKQERTWTEFDKTNISTKKSKCSRYVVAYFEDDEEEDNEQEYVDIFDVIEDKWLFRVNHNTYKRYDICKIIEFIEQNGKTYVLINDEHSVLSLYDMNGNLYKQFDDCDDFYTKYFKVVDNEKEWLVFYGFIWSPLYFMKIFDVEQMMIVEEYEPELYVKYLENIHKINEVTSNKVCIFNDEYYTPTEYRDLVKSTEDEIELKYVTKLNDLWSNDNNVFKKILREETKANIIYKNADLKDEVFKLMKKEFTNADCVGGNSGSNFREHLEYMLTSSINDLWNDDYDKVPDFIQGKDDTIIVDTIASTLYHPYKKHTNIVHNYKKNGTLLSVVNLVFSFVFDKTELVINVKFDMIPTEKPNLFYYPDKDDTIDVVIDIR